jgi:hypothetical protein
MQADLTYDGGMDSDNVHFSVSDSSGVNDWDYTITVSNGGTNILTEASFGTGNFSADFPFTVPDEMGTPTNIHVLFQFEPHAGGNVTSLLATVVFSNV